MQKRNFSESKNCAKNEEESLGEKEGGHNLEIRKQGGGGRVICKASCKNNCNS